MTGEARTPTIAIAGHICVDVKARPVRAFPERGRLVETDRIDLVVGGALGNLGRVFGPLGERVVACCRIGSDTWGDIVLADIERWADTTFVTRSTTAPTSSTMVFVEPDGERSFIHAKGANVELGPADVPLDDLARRGIAHLHVAYALLLPGLDGPPMVELLARAQALGMTTSLDMTWDSSGRWMSAIGPLLPHVDVFCPNETEASALTGHDDPVQAARRLLDAGVRRLAVVTRGRDGAVAAVAGGSTIEVGAPGDAVDDATGAGDCFNAALLTALARGVAPREAVAQAAATATAAIAGRL